LDHRHTRGAAHKHHLIQIRSADLGIAQCPLKRPPAALHKVLRQLLEFGSRDTDLQVLGTGGICGDVGQVDIGLHHRGELDLRLLGCLAEPLHRLPILRQIDPLLLFELVKHPTHDALVPVISPQVRIAVSGLHLDQPLADLEDRHVEGATAQIEDQNRLIFGLIQAVGERSGRRLIDDPHHLKPCNLPRVLGGLALAIVEIRRHGDDGLRHTLAKVGLGVLLQLLKHHRRDLLRRVDLVLHRHAHASIVLASGNDLIGHHLTRNLHFRLISPAAHQPLDRINGVLSIHDCLTLGRITNQAIVVLGKGNNRWTQTTPLSRGDHGYLSTFHNRHN